MGVIIGLILLILLLYIFMMTFSSLFNLICMVFIFRKANKEGWEAIVPVYNTVVLIELSGLPMWYLALYFIPFANIYASIAVDIEVAKKFNKSVCFGIGLAFLTPIFLGILAFDKSKYNAINTNNKFCSNCGNKLSNLDKYCNRCGTMI